MAASPAGCPLRGQASATALPGLAPADPGITGEVGGDAAGGPLALTGWLRPRHRRNRPGAVPDVRGLFYHAGLEVATRRGLHLRPVRLTEHPMAVDGLVVDQDPRPPAKAHRGGTLTVQLWHPPGRADRFRAVLARGGEPICGGPDRSRGIASGVGRTGVAVGCREQPGVSGPGASIRSA
jgi:hypothetical protein